MTGHHISNSRIYTFSGYSHGSSPSVPQSKTCPLLQQVLSSLSNGIAVHLEKRCFRLKKEGKNTNSETTIFSIKSISWPQHESTSGVLCPRPRSSPIPKSDRKLVGATVAKSRSWTAPVGANVRSSWNRKLKVRRSKTWIKPDFKRKFMYFL